MKYLQDGTEVDVLAAYEGGYVVQAYIEEQPSEPFNVQKVYEEPPQYLVDEKLDKANKELQLTYDKLKGLRNEFYQLNIAIRTIEAEMKTLDATAQKYDAIKRIVEFLDVGIKYLVLESYGKIWITQPKDEKSGDDKWTNDIKLLTLFGKSNGNLAWKLHHYSDGSGNHYTECHPFINLESATAFAKQRVAELLISEGANDNVIKSANNLGVPIPEAVVLKLHAAKLKQLTNSLDNARKLFHDAKAAVDSFNSSVGSFDNPLDFEE